MKIYSLELGACSTCRFEVEIVETLIGSEYIRLWFTDVLLDYSKGQKGIMGVCKHGIKYSVVFTSRITKAALRYNAFQKSYWILTLEEKDEPISEATAAQ